MRRLVGGACIASLAACALPFGLGAPQNEWQEARVIHGTPVEIQVRHPDEATGRAAIASGFAAAEEIGGKLLAGVRGSEIDILTHVPSHAWVEVSRTTHDALLEASEVAEATDGAYDPTWPPLLKLWGLTEDKEPRVPRDFEIDMALRKVDWTNIEVTDEESVQARRLGRRTELHLGGLARGAMLDAAAAQLRLAGMQAARASTEDEHVVFGGTGQDPWRIPLPGGDADLQDGAIAIAQRGALVKTPSGKAIHHRFDPRNGRPTEGLRWAAVAGQRASTSAAYADAVMAMGRESRDFANERSELLVVLEREDGSVWASPELMFTAD